MHTTRRLSGENRDEDKSPGPGWGQCACRFIKDEEAENQRGEGLARDSGVGTGPKLGGSAREPWHLYLLPGLVEEQNWAGCWEGRWGGQALGACCKGQLQSWEGMEEVPSQTRPEHLLCSPASHQDHFPGAAPTRGSQDFQAAACRSPCAPGQAVSLCQLQRPCLGATEHRAGEHGRCLVWGEVSAHSESTLSLFSRTVEKSRFKKYLFIHSFIHSFKGQSDTERVCKPDRERIFHLLFTLQMVATAGAGPGQSQEAGTQCGSPT